MRNIKNFEAYASAEEFFHGEEKEKPGDWHYRGYLISPEWHYIDNKTRKYNGYNDYKIFANGGDCESGNFLQHATKAICHFNLY